VSQLSCFTHFNIGWVVRLGKTAENGADNGAVGTFIGEWGSHFLGDFPAVKWLSDVVLRENPYGFSILSV
jgi:hypothetical protein